MDRKILIIDDDESIRILVETTLNMKGYLTCCAPNGLIGLEMLHREKPDLILLDLDMPILSGDEVCKKIREDIAFAHLPIIVLTGSRKFGDKVKLLEMGADDYILKPFNKGELLARVKNVLYRLKRSLDANPLTRLPGNGTIVEELNKRIKEKNNLENDFAVCYLDINHFKAFNDYYGFLRGDEIIKTTVCVIVDAVRGQGIDDDFIGHIGGDDFVVVTIPEKIDIVCRRIIENFTRQIPNLYDIDDRNKGYIISKDRRGKEKQFPVMSIAVGVVDTRVRKVSHPGEISTIASELKAHAKSLPGSNYVVDKRHDLSGSFACHR
ncbi:MAG: response regulator [Elusimicrobiota bacterium]